MNNIFVISLGCPKNLVDTEKMLAIYFQGYHLTNDIDQANTIFINTCSFITPSKEESIDTILEYVNYVKQHPEKKIFVSGCLWEQHKESLEKEIPEVNYISNEDIYLKENRVLTTTPYALSLIHI